MQNEIIQTNEIVYVHCLLKTKKQYIIVLLAVDAQTYAC